LVFFFYHTNIIDSLPPIITKPILQWWRKTLREKNPVSPSLKSILHIFPKPKTTMNMQVGRSLKPKKKLKIKENHYHHHWTLSLSLSLSLSLIHTFPKRKRKKKYCHDWKSYASHLPKT
jgi:hypothetical protein